jgi:hypothetical protein
MQKGMVALENLYEKYGFLNLYWICKVAYNSNSNLGIIEKIQTKLKMKFKQN